MKGDVSEENTPVPAQNVLGDDERQEVRGRLLRCLQDLLDFLEAPMCQLDQAAHSRPAEQPSPTR